MQHCALRTLYCALLLSSIQATAQTYPVQLSVQLVPPFSGYLNDYAAPGNDNLRIFLTLTDFTQPSYDVKLKFKLNGNNVNIESRSWYYAGPFTLEPGVPLMLSGTDLAGMLSSTNLDYTGINLAQYNQSKVLPEGFYTITVMAYDFANPLPIQVSNEGMTQAWMMLHDPPLTNLPACGTEVTVLDPQNITFSWTPLSAAAPVSAMGTEYLFELWEVMPPNNQPGNVVLSAAPVYTITTSLTMIMYGIAEPPLQLGWTYVWRVRAYDLEGRALFRNNGYSQICTFIYGDENLLLGNLANLTLSAQVLTHRQAKCMWDSNSVYTNYHLEFRKLNTPNWFPVNTANSNVRLTALEPLTQYEAQVHGIFSNGTDGPWSNIVTFTTPAQAILNCGEASPPPAQQNFIPLAQANTGMIWQVGQFEMVVTQLNNTANPNGLYSGLGKMIMPLGITLNVSYTNIQVGTDQVMYAGEVKAVTEGVNAWTTQWQITFNSYESVGINISSGIDSIYLNNLGEIVIIDESGHSSVLSNPSNGNNNIIVNDINGDAWVISPNGNVVFVPAQISNAIKQALIEIDDESEDVISDHAANLNTTTQQLEASRDTIADPIPADIDFAIITSDTTNSTVIPASENSFATLAFSRQNSARNYFTQYTLDAIAETAIQNSTWAELALLMRNNRTLLESMQQFAAAGNSSGQLVAFAKQEIQLSVAQIIYKFMFNK